MKREKQRLRVKHCYEPNRFAQDNIINAYEVLCPDKKTAITDKSEINDTPLSTDNSTLKRRKQ